jgi:hypothetical protein
MFTRNLTATEFVWAAESDFAFHAFATLSCMAMAGDEDDDFEDDDFDSDFEDGYDDDDYEDDYEDKDY